MINTTDIIKSHKTTDANPFRAIAKRIVAAENDFLETLQSFGDIPRSDAIKVLSVYRKLKLVKIDPVGGRLTVKHGSFLDRDVINNAISYQL